MIEPWLAAGREDGILDFSNGCDGGARFGGRREDFGIETHVLKFVARVNGKAPGQGNFRLSWVRHPCMRTLP